MLSSRYNMIINERILNVSYLAYLTSRGDNFCFIFCKTHEMYDISDENKTQTVNTVV